MKKREFDKLLAELGAEALFSRADGFLWATVYAPPGKRWAHLCALGSKALQAETQSYAGATDLLRGELALMMSEGLVDAGSDYQPGGVVKLSARGR